VTGEAVDAEVTLEKFTAPLLDTPKSVTVVSKGLIQATGATSLVEALRTVPGITFNAGEGGIPAGDNLKIRGFDAGSDVFIDGARDAGTQTRDVFALEQIEVVKGPGSAYSGRGSSGGSVNLVTKKPLEEDLFVANIGAGTDSFGRATLDTSYRIGDSMGLRLNLLRQDADVPGRNEVSTSHWGIAPSLAFGIGKPTRVNLDFYRYETDDVPDYSIPYARNADNSAPAGEPIDVDRDNFYGVLSRDFQRTGADIRTLQVERDLAGGLTLSNTTRYGTTTNHYIVTNPDDGRANIPYGFVLRNTKNRDSVTTTAANLTNFAGMGMTGDVMHSCAFGFEASNEEMINRPYSVESQFSGRANTDFANSCSAPGAVGPASNYNCTTLANPNPHDPWTGTITKSANVTRAETDTRSIYAFDTLDLNERWLLNLGVRYDDYSTEQLSFSNGTRLTNESDFWNYQAGLVLKVAPTGRVYFSTGTSSNPSGNTLGDGTENISSSNEDLKPERDRTLEVGTKWALADDRLSVTSALFQTVTDNARAVSSGGGQELIGEERVKGFEIGASGAVGERVQLFGSYTFLDSEIVDDGPVDVDEGNVFPNTPRNSFSVWTSYAASSNVTIGGGASYVDLRYGNTENTLWIPSYWRFDVMASMRVGTRVNLQLNVQNLTDETYYVRPYRSHYAQLGPARSAILSASIDF
jgi:catecholate siderophore receptor